MDVANQPERPFLRRYRMELILAGIILLSAFLNLWNITNTGYSNTYYAAAVKSMLENPGVLFFNSFDAGGFVTVDKPPLGLWVQAASAILFGFSGWALILPQALAGIASVALLYWIISRPFGKPAGLIASFALAVTPIFVAVSRNGTMDGVLIFIILLAVWAALKAAEKNSLAYLLLAVTLGGLGFNIKMIQAFIVVPAILSVYFLGAKEVPVKGRLLHITLAIALLTVVSLSWAVAVDMVPADQRPYIGGSGDNTVMGLIVNYNGIHRLESDGMGGPGNGGGQPPGPMSAQNQSRNLREGVMIQDAGGYSGQNAPSSWQDRNNDPGTAGLSQNMTGSRMSPAMAPNAGSLSGEGNLPPQGSMSQAGMFSGTGPGTVPANGAPGGSGGMDNTGSPGAFRLFNSGLAGQLTWLLPFALIGLLAWIRRPVDWSMKGIEDAGYFGERGLVLLAMCLWLFPGLVYFSFTTGFWHTYYLATIAPPLAALTGIGAAGMYTAYRDGQKTGWILVAAIFTTGLIQAAFLLSSGITWAGTILLILTNAVILITVILAALMVTGRTGSGNLPKIVTAVAIGLLFIAPCIWAFSTVGNGGGQLPVGGPQTGRGSMGSMASGPGGDGMTGPGSADTGLTDYLISHRSGETWIVAVQSSMEASNIILSTGEPVMAMGGFSGSDRILTTSSVLTLVNQGKIRYFLISSSTGDRAGPGSNTEISSWVGSHCSAVPASDYYGDGSGGRTSGTGLLSGGQSGRTLYDCRNTTE